MKTVFVTSAIILAISPLKAAVPYVINTLAEPRQVPVPSATYRKKTSFQGAIPAAWATSFLFRNTP